jgi:hypothetical protein
MSEEKRIVSVVKVSIHREGESPVYGETVTTVELADEGAGPFLALRQPGRESPGEIRLDLEELPLLLEAARVLIG